jgi:hypothetical protein
VAENKEVPDSNIGVPPYVSTRIIAPCDIITGITIITTSIITTTIIIIITITIITSSC